MARKHNGRNSSGGNPRRRVSHAETYGAVQHEFLAVLKEREFATVDAIYDRLDIPDSARMKIGTAIRGLAEHGLIVRVDFERTERPKAHGRHVTVWRLAR